MKRRKFIQAGLISPLIAASGTRLHGAPASIDQTAGAAAAEKFVLPLTNAGLPSSEIAELSRVSLLIESVLTDPRQANAFFLSPRSYFDMHGLDGSDATLVDGSVALLIALTDPIVKDAIVNHDYRQLFNHLSLSGFFETNSPSALQERVRQVISANIAEIAEAISSIKDAPFKKTDFISILKKSGIAATEDDLAAVAHILGEDSGVVIMACSAMVTCVVGIALLAALYVSAAIAVTVAILAGITISAAMMTAVTAGGGPRPLPFTLFTGQFTKLDPVAFRNAQRAYRLAEISGDPGLHIYALRSLMREEVNAVLAALSDLRLINISSADMPLAIDVITCYAEKAAGIGEGNGN